MKIVKQGGLTVMEFDESRMALDEHFNKLEREQPKRWKQPKGKV